MTHDDDAAPRERPGIKAVAARAGVGIASVSRVLSGRPGASPALAQRVLEAAQALGYVPNALAQGLRRRSTRSVGFVVPDFTHPLGAAVAAGAERVLAGAGFSLLLATSGGDAGTDAERLDRLLQRQVDGLVVLPALEDDPATLAALRGATAPVVVIDRQLPQDVGAHHVVSDHYRGVGDAARWLLDAGHRRIGLVVGRDLRPTRERIRAVHDACESQARFDGLVLHRGLLTPAHGEAALEELLSSADPPTAVILGDDALLEGALRVVHRRGLRLGTDLSLVGCDDGPLGRGHVPPIATVTRDAMQLGRRAVEVLLRRLAGGGGAPEMVIEPAWFEWRASCGPAPSGPRADDDRRRDVA